MTLPDPADRGRTTIADSVVERIAAHAAGSVPHAAGLRRSVAGVGLGAPTVRARAAVDGAVGSVRLDLAVDYPAPVRKVTRAVRHEVVDQVGRFAGVRLDHVDIVVSALRRSDDPPRRVV